MCKDGLRKASKKWEKLFCYLTYKKRKCFPRFVLKIHPQRMTRNQTNKCMQKATERMQANTQPVYRYCIYNIIYIYGKKYSLAIYRTSYFSGNEKKTRKLFLLIPAVIWNNIRRKDKRKQEWKETKAEQIYRNTTNNNKTEEKNKNISVSSLTNCRAAKKKQYK